MGKCQSGEALISDRVWIFDALCQFHHNEQDPHPSLRFQVAGQVFLLYFENIHLF